MKTAHQMYKNTLDFLTFATSCNRNIPWPGLDVEDDGFLNPRNEEMCTFTYSFLANTSETIEDDCTVTCIDWNEERVYLLLDFNCYINLRPLSSL